MDARFGGVRRSGAVADVVDVGFRLTGVRTGVAIDDCGLDGEGVAGAFFDFERTGLPSRLFDGSKLVRMEKMFLWYGPIPISVVLGRAYQFRREGDGEGDGRVGVDGAGEIATGPVILRVLVGARKFKPSISISASLIYPLKWQGLRIVGVSSELLAGLRDDR